MKRQQKPRQANAAQRSEAKTGRKGQRSGKNVNHGPASGGKGSTEAARSIQDDDHVGDHVAARLACCLEGVDPVEWLALRVRDQAYQRETMKPALKKLVKLLENLSKLERGRPFRVRGEELLEQSRQYLRKAKVCEGYGRPGERLDFQPPRERCLAPPEGPTFSEFASLIRDRLEGIPPAPRGPHADLVQDLEHDTNERFYGAKRADEMHTPESKKSREEFKKAFQDKLRKARAKRSKAMIDQVQRDIEGQLQDVPNGSWRRNLEAALAETRECDTSRERMAALVLSLETRGFGKRISVINLGRYSRALGYVPPPDSDLG